MGDVKAFFLKETFAILKIVTGAATVIGGGFVGYEQYQLSTDPPAPGRFVSVGSKKLHCEVSGEGRSGTPTIVFEGGSGEVTLDWAKVSAIMCKRARCVCYDRSGLGFSEAGSASDSPVDDLAGLLAELGVDGPIVLVAQGAGAFNARAFIAACGDDGGRFSGKFQVAGAVLLDPVCDGVKSAHKALHPKVEAAIVSSSGAVPCSEFM
jgi:pimeloyl-ACP methyl ester carboxylesterase